MVDDGPRRRRLGIPGSRPLRGALIDTYLVGAPLLKRAWSRALSAVVPSRRRVELYWCAEDPYSHLVAQLLDRLLVGAEVELEVVVVSMPKDAVNPEPELRQHHVARDSAALAAYYELDFPADWQLPGRGASLAASAAVLRAELCDRLQVVLEMGTRLWAGEPIHDDASSNIEAELARNDALMRRRGHYMPGTIRFLGEWLEGVCRVDYLVRRLRAQGPSLLVRRFEPRLPVAPPGAPLQMWFSFRSPYSYLAIQRVAQWVEQGLEIDFRPLLPMVQRGLPVPRAKRLYLVHDAKREADRLGIPFGHIADPVGIGAENCLAVCAALGDSRRAFNFAVSASRGIWSEAVDVADRRGLVWVAERGGVSAGEVEAALADIAAGAELAAENRSILNEAGLWGVPSFRVGDFVTWGNDRLELVAHVARLSSVGPSSVGPSSVRAS